MSTYETFYDLLLIPALTIHHEEGQLLSGRQNQTFKRVFSTWPTKLSAALKSIGIKDGEKKIIQHLLLGNGVLDLGSDTHPETVFIKIDDQTGVLFFEKFHDHATIHPYKNIVENIPIASYVILPDEGYPISYLSPAIEEVTGYTAETCKYQNFYRTRIHEDDKDQVMKQVEKAITEQRVYDLTYRLRHRSGDTVWIYERGQAVFKTNGDIAYFTGVMLNVTTSKHIEHLLNRRESILMAILEATREILSSEDFDYALTHCFKRLGEVSEVDRIYYYRVNTDAQSRWASISHEWVSEGTVPFIDHKEHEAVLLDNQVEMLERLTKNRYFEAIVQDLADSEFKSFLLNQQIKSLIIFPIFIHETFSGFIGFDDIRQERLFDILERQLLASFTRSVEVALETDEDFKQLQQQTQLFNTVFEAIGNAMIVIDKDMKVLHINQAMSYFLKSPFKAGMLCHELLYGFDEVCHNCVVKKVFDTKKSARLETNLHYGANYEYVEIQAYPIMDQRNEQVTSVVQVIRDITSRKKYELNLKKMSEKDTLTDVYNRAYFDQCLASLNGKETHYTILSIDLDGLKIINDTLGHHIGDQMLVQTAVNLQSCLIEDDVVARIGGDEFAVITKRPIEQVDALVEQLHQQFDSIYEESKDAYLSVSIGFCSHAEDMTSYDVLRISDEQMYSQKLRKGQSAKSHIIKTLLVTLKERDRHTESHGLRLKEYVTSLAKHLKLNARQIANLQTLAEVHDIGKIAIPDAILLKPGPLTDKEWGIMKSHPEKGYRIASNSPELIAISEFILKHHEHYDGFGYPLGIKGDAIPIECRVLAVCDAYDAMTTDRPYREALAHEKAVLELKKCRDTQFDSKIVDLFIEKVLKQKNT